MTGDHGGGAYVGDALADGVAVVGFVGENMVGPEPVEQGRYLGRIAPLAGRQDHPERPTLGVGSEVDFGGQASSGPPQSLIAPPLFRLPPAGGADQGTLLLTGVPTEIAFPGLSVGLIGNSRG